MEGPALPEPTQTCGQKRRIVDSEAKPLMSTALSLIIPLYNEAARLQRGLEGVQELTSFLEEPPELILVDDGSWDATVAVAKRLAPEARLLLEPHRGKGGALKAGVAASRGQRILLTDVDWSVSPQQIAEMLKRSAPVVIASREGPGARRVGEPTWRHLLGRAFNQMVQPGLLSGHADTQCGCKLLDGALARSLFPKLTIEGWAYDVELLYLLHREGVPVEVVPVSWRFEADSRLRPLKDGWEMAKEVWKIRQNVRKGRY